MRKLAFTLSLAALLCSCARADEVSAPYAYVSASTDGRCYFKMLPDAKEPYMWDRNGSGTMYAVSAAGADKPLWSVSGWYAFSTYVAYDSRYLVRMGNWPPGEPSKEHLAIAFYESGKLIRSYSTLDLLKNPAGVPKSVSHYQYLKEVIGFKEDLGKFTIRTVEDVEYTFDIRTGNIVSEKRAADNHNVAFGLQIWMFFAGYGIA
jgi:hypothetical protein